MKTKHTPRLIPLLAFLFAAFFAPAGAHDTLRRPTGYADLDLFYRQLDKNIFDTDKARTAYLSENTPLDTLTTRFIEKGLWGTFADTVSLYSLFGYGDCRLSAPQMLAVKQQVYAAADKRGKKSLKREIDYLYGRGVKKGSYEEQIEWLEQVATRARKAGDTYLEQHSMFAMWYISFFSSKYAKSFIYASRVAEGLDKIDDAFPEKGIEYCWLGLAYYNFKDYDKALCYLKKCFTYRDTIKQSGDSYVRSLNHLAVYYEINEQPDSAAHYHRAVLTDPAIYTVSPAHLAIAICNLGRIEMRKSNYNAAIPMLQAGLQVMKALNDEPDFIAGIHTSLGECYLAKGDIEATRMQIDSAHSELSGFESNGKHGRLKALYALQSNYHSRLGEHHRAKLYIDSALVSTQIHQEKNGQHIILLGEQELQEVEARHGKERIARQRNIILCVTAALVLLCLTLLIILRLYRIRNAAYKKLAQKAQEWAAPSGKESPQAVKSTPAPTPANPKAAATAEDLAILALVEKEMTENHAYRHASLTAEAMAEQLGIHRNLLSRVINHTTGSNFNNYINSYRIKEAVLIISETDRSQLYIEQVYERVGFGNRNSFYRTFKQFTGLTPTEFRKSKDQPTGQAEF